MEGGPCFVDGVGTMDDSCLTIRIKFRSGPVAAQIGCIALLDTGSPYTFINIPALKSLKRAGAASVIFKRHTLPRSSRCDCKPPQPSAAVRFERTVLPQRPTDRVTHTLSHAKLCNTTCYSETKAGCSSMAALTVRWLAARAKIVFIRPYAIAPTTRYSICS